MNILKSISSLLLLISAFTLSGWCDTYKEARKLFQSNYQPWFVEVQIHSVYNSEPAELPQAVTFPEVESLLSQYQQQKNSTLHDVIHTIEPALLVEDGLYIQSQATDLSVDSLLTNQLNIDLVLNVAYNRNPSIKAASQAWQASLERYPQAAFLEGILRQYNSFTKTLDLLLGGMQPQKQMIDTQWPFPGVTSLRGDIVQTDIEIAKQEYAITLRDVLSEVKKTFYDLAYIHHAIEITKENRVLLEQMLDVASQKFEAGNTSYNDVITARISLSKLTDNLITLEDQSTTIASRLNFLLNRSPNAPIGKVSVPNIQAMKIKLDHLYELAQEKRQEIQKLSLMIQRTDLMIDLAQEMNRPDPTLGASYFQDRSGLLVGSEPDRETFQSAPRQQLRPWFGQRESFIAEMQERKHELASKLDNLINQTLFEIKNAHFSLDVAYRETELYRTTLIPESRQSLEVAETDYLGARIDFLDYLDAQRTWLDFNLSYYKAKSAFGIARAELERNLGSSLQINSQTNNQ